MTCREAIDLLADYLEATLTPQALGRLEAHLDDCPACTAYLATYRRTRDLAVAFGRIEMPPELKERLRGFLLDQLGRTP
jgi:anti-sigma factor RsiW